MVFYYQKSNIALKAFIEIKSIKDKIGVIDLTSLDRLIVNCELISHTESKFRADIVLRFYKSGRPYKALLIEAKSINKRTSAESAEKQLQDYGSKDAFKELFEFGDNQYSITLTKMPKYEKKDFAISVTWSDIIEAFYSVKSQDELLSDYFKFITNINGAMKFFEQEVYSIPTVEWSKNAIDKYSVYECPNSGRYLIKQKPLYLTFRKSGGGEMDKLFKVEDIIIINFKEDFETFTNDERYDNRFRERVAKYAEYMLKEEIWLELPSDDKQVFILSDNPIELKNKPKPKNGNNSFRAYYELADLINNETV